MDVDQDSGENMPARKSLENDFEHNENVHLNLVSHKDLQNNLVEQNLNEDTCSDDESYSTPVEILAEFLSTLMARDYRSALHYCKLILQYEPDNKIIQEFYPLIQDKLYYDHFDSDEFTDNEGSSYASRSEKSTEYFSSTSASADNTSACSSFSSDEEEISLSDSQ